MILVYRTLFLFGTDSVSRSVCNILVLVMYLSVSGNLIWMFLGFIRSVFVVFQHSASLFLCHLHLLVGLLVCSLHTAEFDALLEYCRILFANV